MTIQCFAIKADGSQCHRSAVHEVKSNDGFYFALCEWHLEQLFAHEALVLIGLSESSLFEEATAELSVTQKEGSHV